MKKPLKKDFEKLFSPDLVTIDKEAYINALESYVKHLELLKINIESQKAELLEALKDIVEQAEKTKTMLPADLADSINIFGKQAIKNAE